jgi:hypothetical protein
VCSPPKARLTSPIKRRSDNTQSPVTNCGERKPPLAGKRSDRCSSGIEPRRCSYKFRIRIQRNSGTASAIPEPRKSSCGSEHATRSTSARSGATLMIREGSGGRARLAARRPLLCHPANRVPNGQGLGQYAVLRWPMSSTKIGEASLIGIWRALF